MAHCTHGVVCRISWRVNFLDPSRMSVRLKPPKNIIIFHVRAGRASRDTEREAKVAYFLAPFNTLFFDLPLFRDNPRVLRGISR